MKRLRLEKPLPACGLPKVQAKAQWFGTGLTMTETPIHCPCPLPQPLVVFQLFSHSVAPSAWAFQGSWTFRVVLLCPICSILVSCVSTPGPKSLLGIPCKERKYLPEFASKTEGRRANWLISYHVPGLYLRPHLFYALTLWGRYEHLCCAKGKTDSWEGSGPLSKLLGLEEGKLGFPVCSEYTCLEAFCCVRKLGLP